MAFSRKKSIRKTGLDTALMMNTIMKAG